MRPKITYLTCSNKLPAEIEEKNYFGSKRTKTFSPIYFSRPFLCLLHDDLRLVDIGRDTLMRENGST